MLLGSLTHQLETDHGLLLVRALWQEELGNESEKRQEGNGGKSQGQEL